MRRRQWLELATDQTPRGLMCTIVCRACVAAGNPPPVRSWGQAAWRVGAHCQHLGLDLDQMAALLQAEHQERVTEPHHRPCSLGRTP